MAGDYALSYPDFALSVHTSGWLCQIRLTNPGEFEVLLGKEAYEKLTAESS